MPKQNNSSAYNPQQTKGRQLLRGLLVTLTVLTLLNLLFTASLAGLIGGIVILIMVWGIRKGDYGLRKALIVFLLLYAAVNLVVLILSALFSSTARVLSLIWLGVYSLCLVVCALLLRCPEVRAWLEVAPQPTEKEKKIHFFHGGWRDL
mgnify:FL=1